MRIVLMSIALLFAPFSASASQTQAPEGEPDAATPKQVKVCKYQARSATRFKTKVCHTKVDWEAMSEAAKQQAAEEFTKPTISIERGN